MVIRLAALSCRWQVKNRLNRANKIFKINFSLGKKKKSIYIKSLFNIEADGKCYFNLERVNKICVFG